MNNPPFGEFVIALGDRTNKLIADLKRANYRVDPNGNLVYTVTNTIERIEGVPVKVQFLNKPWKTW